VFLLAPYGIFRMATLVLPGFFQRGRIACVSCGLSQRLNGGFRIVEGDRSITFFIMVPFMTWMKSEGCLSWKTAPIVRRLEPWLNANWMICDARSPPCDRWNPL
jgi:hypothetical protein